jgi:hypothetical protein
VLPSPVACWLILYLTALSVPRLHSVDDRTINEYGAVGGIRFGRGKRRTRRKRAPMSLCPPEIPQDLTWDGTRVAAVGSRRLTA